MITAKGLQQLGFISLTDFVLQDDSDGNGTYIAEWLSDQPQPSLADIEAAHAVWQSIYDNNQYQRDRATEYPAIADQLDDIFHNGIDGWKATIQLTKDKYPKGGN
jgi:hypothetical protein